MELFNQGMLVFELVFERIFVITGCQIPHCLQNFHRDIPETTDHSTNKLYIYFCHYVSVVYSCY